MPIGYRVTIVDAIWARMVLDWLAEDGVIAMPDSRLIYRVSHQQKVMYLTNPEELASTGSKETHARTKKVFAVWGYRVLTGKN